MGIGNTILGAAVAVLAMRLLWPEREQAAMKRLLARGALADAEYVRAMLDFWSSVSSSRSTTGRVDADRRLLAPARRACGLAINDAEEALDRIMLEPQVPLARAARWETALTFVTYLRRMTRAVATLAAIGNNEDDLRARAEDVALRMERLGENLKASLSNHAVSSIERAEIEASTAASTLGRIPQLNISFGGWNGRPEFWNEPQERLPKNGASCSTPGSLAESERGTLPHRAQGQTGDDQTGT